jgi:hypothetical protein
MKSIKAFLVVMFVVLCASSAFATPVTGLVVDFRDSSWAGANGSSSFSVGDVMLSAMPLGSSVLYQDSVDGVGIASSGESAGTADEVGKKELLEVDFLTALYSSGVWVSDLFAAPDGSTIYGEVGYAKVFYDIGGMTEFEFFGIDSESMNGEQFIAFGGNLSLTKVEFYSSGLAGDEFSVMGFAAPVPEPGTLVLVGVGLVGLACLKRRKS